MSITVIWDNPEQSIIRYTLRDQWTWDELFDALAQEHELQASVPHPADILVDMRRSGRLPGGAIAHFKTFAGMSQPNTGIRVVVTGDHFVISLFDIFARLYQSAAEHYRFAHTLNEAYLMIEEHRAGIRKDEV